MLTVNTAAGHRGPALVGHGVLKASGGERGKSREAGNGRWNWMRRGIFYSRYMEEEGEIVCSSWRFCFALSTCILKGQGN